ncbi:MAG TPA: hypothetical protein VF638_12955 [Sphingomonas sp.]|jgi:hypothetical protein
MDNQHQKIAGYRDLDQTDIDAMNSVKRLEARFNGMIDHLRGMPNADQRHVAIAATAGEEAFMRAVRAIAKPERIVEPFTEATQGE